MTAVSSQLLVIEWLCDLRSCRRLRVCWRDTGVALPVETTEAAGMGRQHP